MNKLDKVCLGIAAGALLTAGLAVAERGDDSDRKSKNGRVEGTVAGVEVVLEFGRPNVKGREIWGGLVPYDEVWRTGANAATHFTTDRDLRLGELLVPAGSYTLWSTYTPDSAHLIVNRQTDQWGTQYDPGQDLGRVEMERSALDEPVERFTISVEEGELRLEWDETRFSVPITVPE